MAKPELLRRKLHQEQSRSEHLSTRLSALEQELRSAEERISLLVEREAFPSAELAALEHASVSVANDGCAPEASALLDRRLLYVGGRPGQVAQRKAMVRRQGGELMSHDGGLEDSTSLLPGMISTADAVYFPVD